MTWMLVVALSLGAEMFVGEFPSLQACVAAAEAADAALHELDEEDWVVECCQAGACILEAGGTR